MESVPSCSVVYQDLKEIRIKDLKQNYIDISHVLF